MHYGGIGQNVIRFMSMVPGASHSSSQTEKFAGSIWNSITELLVKRESYAG
jgi:hypothetical protein